MVTLIELHQPQGDAVLINLNTVTRIWAAKEGGTGMSFLSPQFNNGMSSCIYREKFQDVQMILKKAGAVIL
jgi:hypothetical protein